MATRMRFGTTSWRSCSRGFEDSHERRDAFFLVTLRPLLRRLTGTSGGFNFGPESGLLFANRLLRLTAFFFRGILRERATTMGPSWKSRLEQLRQHGRCDLTLPRASVKGGSGGLHIANPGLTGFLSRADRRRRLCERCHAGPRLLELAEIGEEVAAENGVRAAVA